MITKKNKIVGSKHYLPQIKSMVPVLESNKHYVIDINPYRGNECFKTYNVDFNVVLYINKVMDTGDHFVIDYNIDILDKGVAKPDTKALEDFIEVIAAMIIKNNIKWKKHIPTS